MKTLIIKYLSDSIDKEELEKLQRWLKFPENRKVFEAHVRKSHNINLTLMDADIDKAFEKFKGTISKKGKPVRKFVSRWVKYAAALALIFGLGYLFQYRNTNSDILIISENESIVLELANGSKKIIDPATSQTVKNVDGSVAGVQKTNQLDYTEGTSTQTLAYNTLYVPYGKQFEIKLSDGTEVHLNSGSSLKYPIKFMGKVDKRQVFLTGEAYFKVSEDTEHPFVVNAETLNVQVLGTIFNVSAYPEDQLVDVVLVEGKVGLYTEDQGAENAITITPGIKGTLHKDSSELMITTGKVSTRIYTAWMDGELVFRNMPFEKIMKKLERHYNITIINTNPLLGKEVFSASFVNEPIENVLNYFNDSYALKYEIKDNQVIIR